MWKLDNCPRCGGDVCTTDDNSCLQCGFTVGARMLYPPMLAKLSETVFDSPGYLYEPKLDGIRAIVYYDAKSGTRILNRNGVDITKRFPEIRIKIEANSAVLDGELVCFDKNKRPNFQLIQTRMHRTTNIAIYAQEIPSKFVAFDIMEIDGKPLIREELISRKMELNRMKPCRSSFVLPYVFGTGTKLMKTMESKGWEGMMAKEITSPYECGKRTMFWLKMKVRKHGCFKIVGCTPGYGKRKETFGALIIAKQEGDKLIAVGEVGTGFTEVEERQILDLMKVLKTKKCPCEDVPKSYPLIWIEPIDVRVSYLEETNNGQIRFPVYEGLGDGLDEGEAVSS